MSSEINRHLSFLPKQIQYTKPYDTNHTQFLNNTIFGSKHKMRLPKYRINPVIKKFLVWLSVIFLAICLVAIKTLNHTLKSNTKKLYYVELNLPNVVMHLDLKGSPMRLSYLKTLLPMLRQSGVTGFLINYEDMFPYEDGLASLSSKYAYDRIDLRLFLKVVAKFGFDVIPLVQTFDYMEYIDLRKVSQHSDVICTSNPKSLELIRNILKQIIKFHQNIYPLKFLHIGRSNVFHWNENKYKRCNKSNTHLFFNHVKTITNYIKNLSPRTSVLIWDDMLRDISEEEWINIKELKVEPVYWDYSSTVHLSQEVLSNYYENFRYIWIASAFKGADRSRIMQPILINRFSNIWSWMELIRKCTSIGNKDVCNFKGIILSGWSRYLDGTPSELLPVSLPSLLAALILLEKYKIGSNLLESYDAIDFYDKNVKIDLGLILKCNEDVDVEYFETNICEYEGSELYATVNSCDSVTFHVQSYTADNLLKYIDNNPKTEAIKMYNESLYDLWCLENKLIRIMSKYYTDHFITEYVIYKFNLAKNILYRLLSVNASRDNNFKDLVGVGT